MQLTLSEEARLDQLGVDHRVRRLLRDSLRGLNDQEIRGEGAEYSCGVAQVVEAARGLEIGEAFRELTGSPLCLLWLVVALVQRQSPEQLLRAARQVVRMRPAAMMTMRVVLVVMVFDMKKKMIMLMMVMMLAKMARLESGSMLVPNITRLGKYWVIAGQAYTTEALGELEPPRSGYFGDRLASWVSAMALPSVVTRNGFSEKDSGLEAGRLPCRTSLGVGVAEFAAMLPAPAALACGIVFLPVHATLAGWDLEGLLTAWLSWIQKRAETLKKPELQDRLVEDAMKKMMLEHYQQVLRYVSNFAAVVVAIHANRLQQQPDFASICQFLVVFLQYLAACWVARWNVSFHTLRLLNLLSHIGHVSYVINMHVSAEEADYNFHSVYSAALRVFVAAVIHDAPVIIPCQTFVCVVEVACHFCLEGAAPRGPPWHFLGAQAAILLLVCGVAIMVQERARASIRASLQSADANLSLEGFQRVLRSVCDADVLLDDGFNIVGDNTRLRRVLATPTDLQGVKFTDLLDQDGKTEFETFVRKSCSASQSPRKKEEKDNSCSIPPCLRVSLPSAYSRVGVDIFHVPVPRFVDAAGPLHLLAFTEDPDTRIQPDATLGAIPEALSVYSEADDVQDRI
ncbi:unnamed protein product [Symbiodinium sp. KB8]|nr:unnamed protein product [Symbiodinium sp. KB8]